MLKMSYCSRCGAEARETARFCTECGSQLRTFKPTATDSAPTFAPIMGLMSQDYEDRNSQQKKVREILDTYYRELGLKEGEFLENWEDSHRQQLGPYYRSKPNRERRDPYSEWEPKGWKKGLFYAVGIPWAIVICTISFGLLIGVPAFLIWLFFFS